MKQTNSLSSKDENMSSENGAAGLTQDQLLFTENIYASLPMRVSKFMMLMVSYVKSTIRH